MTATASACRSPTSSRTRPLGLAHAVLTAEPFLRRLARSSCTWATTCCRAGSRTSSRRSARNQPEALILLTPVPDPRELRRGRARRRRRGGPAGREAGGAEVRPRAGRRLHVHAAHPRGGAGDPSPRPAASWRSPTRSSGWSTAATRVEPHIVRGWWKDTGRLDDMLEANRLDPRDDRAPRRRASSIDSQVEGRVVVEAGRPLERSTVRGPAIIGAGARLSDAYIGPYTAIGGRLRDRERRDRALDPARGLIGARPRRPDGVLAARPQRHDLARRSASRAPTASWSATPPRSGSSSRSRSAE